MVIYKYKLNPENELELPKGARILSAGVQGDDIYIWALVNEYAPNELRRIEVYGTGHEIEYPQGLKFINTVFLDWMVFHVFERVV